MFSCTDISMAPCSMKGVLCKGKYLKTHRDGLTSKLQQLYSIHTAHCVRVASLCGKVQQATKQLKCMGAAIASEGPGPLHTLGYLPTMSPEAYQQKAQDALHHMESAMTKHKDRYEGLSQQLPRPQLVTVLFDSSNVKRNSLILQPCKQEQDIYEQALRLSDGNKKLLPLCYEVCILQRQAAALLETINKQAQAIDELYNRLTAQGVFQVLLEVESSFPERLVAQLTCEVLNQVDWLLPQPSYFDDVSPAGPACFIHDEEQQPAVDQHQEAAYHQQAAVYQQPQLPAEPVVVETTCTVGVVLEGKGSKKAKGMVGLKFKEACKQLVAEMCADLKGLSKKARKVARKAFGIPKSASCKVAA